MLPSDVILMYLEMLIGDSIHIDVEKASVVMCPGPEELGMYKVLFSHWVVDQLKR